MRPGSRPLNRPIATISSHWTSSLNSRAIRQKSVQLCPILLQSPFLPPDCRTGGGTVTADDLHALINDHATKHNLDPAELKDEVKAHLAEQGITSITNINLPQAYELARSYIDNQTKKEEVPAKQ